MKKQQNQHRSELSALLNNIPVGILQCEMNSEFTIIDMNAGFLNLCGYTEEELREQFHNRYIELIHPSDRQDVIEKMTRQLSEQGTATYNYRILCKDGRSKWLMENTQIIKRDNGEQYLICVMLDITESQNAKEELRLSMERHQIIMDHTTDILFEWNMVWDTMSFSGNWQKKFGYAPQYEGLLCEPPVSRHIHPEDIEVLTTLMKNLREGMNYPTVEIRIQNKEGRFIWCRLWAVVQYDDCRRPLKAIGVIMDIDEEKRMIDDLRRRAERDALTGLYNRIEAEHQITSYLEKNPNDTCALFMLDLDDFKIINNHLGHLLGDAALTELAAGMKKLTRQTDVVGRIGGEEFVIFLKGIPSREIAVKKAEQVLEMVRTLFSNEKRNVHITCSIGVAICPNDGNDFASLYRSADIALYQAKKQGKDRYVLFDAEKTSSIEQTGYSSIGAAIDSHHYAAGISGDLICYVFRILYETDDITHAIQLILEIVGKRFDVSRSYIFENSEDGKFTDNTYEWCNEGISPQKDKLQHFAYENLEGYEELFKDNSIFYCRDIHTLTPALAAVFEMQDIHSILQCAIRENGVFFGFVGFDECTGLRIWTQEEISVLSLISQIITTFLYQQRMTDRDKRLAERLNAILDSQDAYIYAIDQDYSLLYLNKKTKELDPGAQTGMPCYSAFFGENAPCRFCPLNEGDCEVHNPKYHLWTKVRVTPMKWDLKDAFLLSCYDITEYKQQ